MKALRDRYAPGAPIWLTETGGAACGGLRWQPTFLDAFRYLDTLSRLAKQGLDAMFTHALISGSNGVIDEKTFQPNASLLGSGAVAPADGNARAGRRCVPLWPPSLCPLPARPPGGVTLLAINLQKASATVGFVALPTSMRYLTRAAEQDRAAQRAPTRAGPSRYPSRHGADVGERKSGDACADQHRFHHLTAG
jgi:hypothetical protein